MVRRLLAMMTLCSALMVAGCSDSDHEATPAEKCDSLISDICNRLVECVGGRTQEQCEEAVGMEIPCGSTKAVSSDYDRCVDQVGENSCYYLFHNDPATGEPVLTLPAACKEVILF